MKPDNLAGDEFPPLPASAQRFLADMMWTIRMQLSQPGRSLKKFSIAVSYYPEGTTSASQTYAALDAADADRRTA